MLCHAYRAELPAASDTEDGLSGGGGGSWVCQQDDCPGCLHDAQDGATHGAFAGVISRLGVSREGATD